MTRRTQETHNMFKQLNLITPPPQTKHDNGTVNNSGKKKFTLTQGIIPKRPTDNAADMEDASKHDSDVIWPGKPSEQVFKNFMLFFALLYGTLGFIGLVMNAVEVNNSSILTYQSLDHGQKTGNVRTVPIVHEVLSIAPELVLAVGSVLLCFFFGLCYLDVTRGYFDTMVDDYRPYHMYLATVFCATIINLTILPLCGFIDVYMLVLATVLTFCIFALLATSDLANHFAINHNETVVLAKQQKATPEETFMHVTNGRICPTFTFIKTGMNFAILTHIVLWIIIFINLASANRHGNVNSVYVFAAVLTFILQTMGFVIKYMQYSSNPAFSLFKHYKLTLLWQQLLHAFNIFVVLIILWSETKHK